MNQNDRLEYALESLKTIYQELCMRPSTKQTNAGIDEVVSAEQWEQKLITVRRMTSKTIDKLVTSAEKAED
jgi:hypothetical protein